MGKIVSLTKIKNESDIVETFVRYHASIVDEMYFVENGSFDGTYEILMALKKEGYPIYLYDESGATFDEERFANQYIYKIAENKDISWILPLDTDEFVTVEAGSELRSILERIKEDKIVSVYWKTYLYKNENKVFNLTNFDTYRSIEAETFKKIIIPTGILCNQDVFVTAGYHGIVSKCKYDIQEVDEIRFAHYPVRSEFQLRKQIVVNRIEKMCHEISNGKAFHWHNIFQQIVNDDFDLYEISKYYATKYQGEIIELRGSIDTNFGDELIHKYDDMSSCKTYQELLFKEVERLAIENAILIRERGLDKDNRKEVIVWGTGNLAETVSIQLVKNEYRIIAYVDSDETKQYSTFNGKLVLPPDKIVEVSHDYLVISSKKYYSEIYDVAIKYERNIQKIKIVEELLLDRYCTTLI